MGTEEQARIVRHYYDLVDGARYDELLALFADDVVYERAGSPPVSGIEQMRAFYLGGRVIDSGAHEIDALVADGGWVAVRGTFRGRLKSGEDVVTRWADFHRFAGAKIAHRYTYFADRPV